MIANLGNAVELLHDEQQALVVTRLRAANGAPVIKATITAAIALRNLILQPANTPSFKTDTGHIP